MSESEYHARQRANALENQQRAQRDLEARATEAGRLLGQIPYMLERVSRLERRVADLEARATHESETTEQA